MKKSKIFISVLMVLLICLSILPQSVKASQTSNPRIEMVISNYIDSLSYGYNYKDSIKSKTTNMAAKAGDKISISFILSGIDNIEAFEVKGLWDTDSIVPGYYTHKSNGDVWNTLTAEAGQSANPIIENTKDLTSDAEWIEGHSFLNAETSRMHLCTYCMEGHDLPQTSTSQCYDEETKVETPYTTDGCIMFIVGFEVLKDVDNVYNLFDWDTQVTQVVAGNGTKYLLSGDNVLRFGPECDHSHNTNELTDCTEGLYCSVCGEELIAPTEHTKEYISNNDGTHKVKCSICGKILDESEACSLENGICQLCKYETQVNDFNPVINDVTINYGDEIYCETPQFDKDDDYNYSYKWYYKGKEYNAEEDGGLRIASTKYSTNGINKDVYCLVTATRIDNGQSLQKKSNTATITINKLPSNIDINENISCEKTFDGKPFEVPPDLYSNPTEQTVVIEYYDKKTNKLLSSAPSNVGTYTVKITLLENDVYNEASTELSVEIKYNDKQQNIINEYNNLPNPGEEPEKYIESLEKIYGDYNNLTKDEQNQLPKDLIELMSNAEIILSDPDNSEKTTNNENNNSVVNDSLNKESVINSKNEISVKTGIEYNYLIITMVSASIIIIELLMKKKNKINQ